MTIYVQVAFTIVLLPVFIRYKSACMSCFGRWHNNWTSQAVYNSNRTMLKNFLLISFRNIRQNKGASLLNILCLALGMATCLFIFHYVRYELNFEAFHEKAAQLCRVETHTKKLGDVINQDALSLLQAGKQLTADYEEVTAYAQLSPYSENGTAFFKKASADSTKGNLFVDKIYFGSASIFDLFSIDLLEGDAKALSTPYTVFLAESVAKELLEDGENLRMLLGEKLTRQSGQTSLPPLRIAGIYEDLPANTHLRFDVLVSIAEKGNDMAMRSTESTYNYVLLRDHSAFESVNASLAETDFDTGFYDTVEKRWWLKPIESIHLSAKVSNEPGTNTNVLFLTFLVIVGFIILSLACTNYVNNAIINSIDRAKEVGIRKLAGISPKQLFLAFLGEAMLINVLAGILGIGLFLLGLRSVTTFTDIIYPVTFDLGILLSSVLFLSLLIIIGTLLSGIYPATLLLSLKPIDALKGKMYLMHSSQSAKGSKVMRILLIFQLTMSIIFISAVYVVQQQLSYMNANSKKPFELNVTGKFPGLSGVNDLYSDQAHRYIEGVKGGSSLVWVDVSNLYNGQIMQIEKIKSLYQAEVDTVGVEEDFLLHVIDQRYWQDSSRIFLAGENFSRILGRDFDKVILNEAALKAIGFNEPMEALDTKLGRYNGYLYVKGIVADDDPTPKVYVTGWRYPTYFQMTITSLGSSAERVNGALTTMRSLWDKQFPHFYFLDRKLEDQGAMEQSLLQMFFFFTFLVVSIACLGIFGLCSFTAIKRTKEIGIRKILGANTAHILLILVLDFMRLMFYSSVVAIPLIIWGAREWLVNYAQRVYLPPWFVGVPILIMSAVAISIIIKQCWPTSVLNPIRALEQD